MEKLKKRNGITIMALVITVIILIIIAGVGLYAGMGIIDSMRLQNINTNFLLVQAKVKTYGERHNFSGDEPLPGTEVGDLIYILNVEALKSMGLEAITQGETVDELYKVNYADPNEIEYIPRIYTRWKNIL